MKKRNFILVLTTLCIMALAGCTQTKETQPKGTSKKEAQAVEEEETPQIDTERYPTFQFLYHEK